MISSNALQGSQRSQLQPILIGIGGCSTAGKTTLARMLEERLDLTTLSMDLYYRDYEQLPFDEQGCRSFDHPESFDWRLLVEHVWMLKRGLPIRRPVYDRRTHSRTKGADETVSPRPFVLVEGILALHWPELCSSYDLPIYLDAPDEILRGRRIAQDIRERGRSESEALSQYNRAVDPMARQYILPSKSRALITLSGIEDPSKLVEDALRAVSRILDFKAG